jgi:DNA invertase Pin-like site-specific DNA recombinase
MADTLPVFAGFERDVLRERVRAGLDLPGKNGIRLGRLAKAAAKATEVGKLFRKRSSKSGISRRLEIGRTSVRRTLAQKESEQTSEIQRYPVRFPVESQLEEIARERLKAA